jgi:hypothetical protein
LAYSFYMDSSALAKRYVPETGSDLVDEILDNVSGRRICLLNVAPGEVVQLGTIRAAGLPSLLRPLPACLGRAGRGPVAKANKSSFSVLIVLQSLA